MNIKNQKLHGLDLQNEREDQGDRFDIDEYLKKYENIMPKYDCRGERIDENGNAEVKTVPTFKKHRSPKRTDTAALPTLTMPSALPALLAIAFLLSGNIKAK